jgi:hypothetical protein
MRVNGFVLIALVLILLCVGTYNMGYRHAVEKAALKHCNPIGSWQEFEVCAEEFRLWMR